jgi:hypothetical protein
MLVTYKEIACALKAKMELSKKKHIIGDKRVEVTLLLDEEAVLKGRDLVPIVERYGKV